MSKTTSQIITDIREMLDDGATDRRFQDAQILNALVRTCDEGFPDFFTPVLDETTFTGTNLVAGNTTQILVPSAFFNGAIFKMEYRQYGTSNYSWTPVSKGFSVDPLTTSTTNAAPKIRYKPIYSTGYELRIWGGVPLTMPTTEGVTIPGTDYPGYVVWLRLQTVVNLLRGRIITASQDGDATAQNFIFAKQDSEAARKKYRMSRD